MIERLKKGRKKKRKKERRRDRRRKGGRRDAGVDRMEDLDTIYFNTHLCFSFNSFSMIAVFSITSPPLISLLSMDCNLSFRASLALAWEFNFVSHDFTHNITPHKSRTSFSVQQHLELSASGMMIYLTTACKLALY